MTSGISAALSAVCAAAGARYAESIDFSGRLGYNIVTESAFGMLKCKG
jgi:hypothetical protein